MEILLSRGRVGTCALSPFSGNFATATFPFTRIMVAACTTISWGNLMPNSDESRAVAAAHNTANNDVACGAMRCGSRAQHFCFTMNVSICSSQKCCVVCRDVMRNAHARLSTRYHRKESLYDPHTTRPVESVGATYSLVYSHWRHRIRTREATTSGESYSTASAISGNKYPTPTQ